MNEVHIIAPSVNSGSLVSQIPGFGSLSVGSGLSLGFHQVCQVRFRIGRVQGVLQMIEHFFVRKLRRAKLSKQFLHVAASGAKPMGALVPLQLCDPLLKLLLFLLCAAQLLLGFLLSSQQLFHLGTHTIPSPPSHCRQQAMQKAPVFRNDALCTDC